MNRPPILLYIALFMLLGTFAAGCEKDTNVEDPVDCELYPEGPGCVSAECNNAPAIVRTEFTPKEGRAPLEVTFDLVAEDLDEKFCSDVLTYHIDFDGDGFVDFEDTEGRGAKHLYTEAGDFKVGIWVTDKTGNPSQKVVKLVKVRPNQEPVISMFQVQEPAQGKVPFDATFKVRAYDVDGLNSQVRSLTINYGDGSVAQLSPIAIAQTAQHQYVSPGNYVATLTACDDTVCVERTASVLAVLDTVTSNFIQTSGSSLAISVDDNDGAHYGHPEYGLHDYVYVADGSIALKVLRLPISAATPAETMLAPSHLVGMVDNVGAGNWKDIEHHKNLAVVAGLGGVAVFDVNPSGTNICEGPWGRNCFPGSVTRPARICPNSSLSQVFVPNPHKKISIYERQVGAGETWAVTAIAKGTNTGGGLAMIRLDEIAFAPDETPNYTRDARLNVPSVNYTYDGQTELTVSGYSLSAILPGDWVYNSSSFARSRVASVNPATGKILLEQGGIYSFGDIHIYEGYDSQTSCWKSGTIVQQKIDKDGLGDDVTAVKVDGEYAYVGTHQNGLQVLNLETFLATGNLSAVAYSMGSDTSIVGTPWAPTSNSVTLTYPERVTATLEPSRFKSTSNGLACLESRSISASNAMWAGGATIATAKAILPGNRVAIAFSGGESPDTNGGAGYLVTGNDGAKTIVEPAPSSGPSTWSILYTIPTWYGVLPKYSGSNPVTISTTQANVIARNARCPNYLNAYEAITAPVGVTYVTAPLVMTPANALDKNGLFIFDRTNRAYPKYLNVVSGLSGPKNGETYDNRFYFGSTGNRGVIYPIDISDPYRPVYEPFTKYIGTFKIQGDNLFDFGIHEMKYHKPSTDKEGVLLIAGGEMGLNALDFAAHANDGPAALVAACTSQFGNSACMNAISGAQLRHDGVIQQIAMAGDYALVAQRRGGVLVFDVSLAGTGLEPRFVSHVRTSGNPAAVNVVDDEFGNPMTLYVADTDSLYIVPFTEPSNPGFNHLSYTPGFDTRYVCTAYTGGRSFTCATDPGTSASTAYVSDGDDLPSVPMKFSIDTTYTPRNECDYSAGNYTLSSYFERMESATLANRLFIFGETGISASKNVIRELELDAFGELELDGSGHAVGCHVGLKNRGVALSYQHRVGATYSGQSEWKRLYTSESNGTVAIFNMDLFEEYLQDPNFDIHNGPPVMRTLDLQDWNNNQALLVKRLIAVGPYLFVAAGDEGAWVIDVSNALSPSVIGQSRISEGSGSTVNALNAIAFPTDPSDLSKGYTYVALIGETGEGGGIRLMRFPGLKAP